MVVIMKYLYFKKHSLKKSIIAIHFYCFFIMIFAANSFAASPGYWRYEGLCGFDESGGEISCVIIGGDPYAITEEVCKRWWPYKDPCTQSDTGHFQPLFSFGIYDFDGTEISVGFKLCGPGKEFDESAQQCIPSTEPDVGENCTENTNHGNPINIFQGNKFHHEIDYIGSGSYPIKFSRYYNSGSGVWTYLPSLSLNGTEVVIQKASGKYLHYFNYIEDEWFSLPRNNNKLESVVDAMGVRTGWRHHLFSTGEVEEYDLQGRIVKSTSRAGITHTFLYTSDQLVISSSEGDSIELNFDVNNKLLSLVDSEQNQIAYTYTALGLISSVTYPDGASKTYHYENLIFPSSLTGITDENGDRFATWGYDSQGRAISSEHASGAEKIIIDYTYENDTTDPRISVTNALGKQTTYHIETNIRNLRFVSRVEGHLSPNCVAANQSYSDNNQGGIYSKTDWRGNVTNYIHDIMQRVIRRAEAVGTPGEKVITTEWHATFNLPTKITEPGKETTFTYDANGNQLGKIVTDTSAL